MVHVLDSQHLGRPGIIAATAVESDAGLVLFDTGPESTFDQLTRELANIGAATADVRHVFVSHIHFDHAGAAWRFAALGARIYVHPRGAPHLIDPSRVMASATRIFGSDMERLWGRVEPISESQVQPVVDRQTIALGKLRMGVLETAGHAGHHHVYHWEDNLFGGDVAGVRLGHGPPIPPFVPPELDVDAWLGSIDKMRALQSARLYLPHFGQVAAGLEQHFDHLEERVRRWSRWFGDGIRAGADEAQLTPAFAQYEAADLRAAGANDEEVEDYERADPSAMAVTASLRYWRKFHGLVPGSGRSS